MTDQNEIDLKRIADKVRALMALASNNPNEHEATAAAAKAQKLLIAYNLNLSDSAEDTKRGNFQFRGGLYKWQRKLWAAIAELHFCLYWAEKGTARGSKYQHKLLGRDVNVVSAKVLAEYLEEAINRLTGDRYTTAPRMYFSREAIAYREGLADRLVERLETKRFEQREAARRKRREEEARNAAAGTHNALTINLTDIEQREADLNNDMKWGWELGTTERQRRESEARYAKFMENHRARVKAEKEADDLLKERDPAAWQAKKDAEKAEFDQRVERDRKRNERNEKRRKGTGGPQPKGPRASSYYDGLADGDSISLDEQVEGTETKAIE